MAIYEGTFTGASRPHTLRLTVNQTSQNIAANTSLVSWTLEAIKHPSWSSYSFSGSNTWSVNIDGFASSGTWTYDFRVVGSVTLASGSHTITHNTDGTKTISSSATAYGTSIGTASCSGSLALTTIPRATQPTVTPTSGDTAVTYTIGHAAASTAFYHDLAYSLDGGGSYTDIATDIVGTDPDSSWTPAHTLFPDSSGGTATIRVITYASLGGAVIGTKTVDLPLTVPASVKPTVSSASWSEGQTVSPDLPTLMGGAGRFVQRWSKLIPTLTTGGAGGSTVTSTQITQNGQNTSSGVAFTNPITLSGSAAFSATASDTRGRVSDTFAGTVTVKPYNYPSLPTPLVSRTSDAGGTTPDPVGTYLAITPAASVSSLDFGDGEKNLLEWRVRTKPVGGSYTTIQDWTNTTVSGNTWTTKYVAAGPYLANTEYVVEVSIRDLFGKEGYSTSSTVKTLEINVPSESVFMDWNGTEGIGIGGYHRGGLLDIHGEARAETFVQDGEPVVSVDQTGIEDGQIIVWDAGSSSWVKGASAGGYPLGAITAWASATEPTWGRFLNGQTIVGGATSLSGIAALYPSWVDGDNLVLPDWGGHTPVGYKSGDDTFFTLGAFVGDKIHDHDLSNNGFAKILTGSGASPAHRGTRITTPAWDSTFAVNATGTATTVSVSVGTPLGGATDVGSSVQPSVVVNWVVCVATSSGEFDTEVQTALVASVNAIEARTAVQDRYTAAALLTTSWATYASVTVTASARPVVVIVTGLYSNSNSGANRTLDFRTQMDGVTLGTEMTGISAPLISGAQNPLCYSETHLVTPTAGSRTFTLQSKVPVAPTVTLQRATITVLEM